jgi:predicted neutral ceramidase superfamily lipid hydrolase
MTYVLRMDTAQDSVKNIPVQGEFTQYLTIISYGFWVQIKCASMQYMLLYSLYDKEPCIHDVLQSMRNEYPLIEYTIRYYAIMYSYVKTSPVYMLYYVYSEHITFHIIHAVQYSVYSKCTGTKLLIS